MPKRKSNTDISTPLPTVEEMSKEPESDGSSTDCLNTEEQPAPPQKEQAPPCVLCKWFEKRLENTMKENVRHMTKYHLD